MNDTSRIVATRPSDVRVDEHDGRYEFEIGRGPLLAQLIGRKGERPWTLIIQGSNGHARIWDRVAPDSPEDLARRARLLPQRDRETGEAYARSLAYKYREVVEGSANTPTRVALRLVESPSPPAPQSPGLPSVDHHDHADHTDRIDHAGSEHRGDPVSGLFPGAWDDADAPDEIKQLNNEYAVVMEGGRGMIWRPSQDQDRIIYERLGERDFQLLKKNQTVEVSVGTVEVGGQLVPKTKLMPLAKYWLEYPKRRTYEHVIFDPTPDFITPADTLNLWRGFAVQPTPGRWDRFDAHLCEVICGGDDQKYRYLRCWLARTLQRPDQRGEVAVVLRGGKGCGKGTLGNALVRLHGQHGLQISSSRYLVGNFNSHLRDLGFLFVDEAFWAGDKQGESVLKSLITEQNVVIEAKYQNPVPAPNRLSILMASNSDWVVPASRDERRYFVLDVADSHVGDHPYFASIYAELEAGGLAAFLHAMLAEDLTGFNHRDVPVTEALEEQVIQTFSPMERWWHERLEEGTPLGEVGASPTAVKGDWNEREILVIKNALHTDFLAFCDRHRITTYHGRDTRKMLGWALKKWLPAGWPQDDWHGGPRSQSKYALPLLSECRRAFSQGRAGLFAAEEAEPSF